MRHVDATGADAQTRGSAVLPSASLSYVLARAAAYYAIREDAAFNAWADRVGGVDGVCVTAGRFARLLAQADQVCVEARTYKGVLWRDGAVGRALVESVRVPLPLLVAHYRGQTSRDRAALTSGRGGRGRRVKLARNVARQETCADSLAEYGVLPVVTWPHVMDGVRALAAGGVVDTDVLPVVEPMAGTGFVS